MRMASYTDFDDNGEAPVTDGLGGDEILDEEGHENLHTRLDEIEKLLAIARESDSPTRLDEIEELEKDKVWINQELSKAQRSQRKAATTRRWRNRVRNRVCKAIRHTVIKSSIRPSARGASCQTRPKPRPHNKLRPERRLNLVNIY